MKELKVINHGRGSQINPANRFDHFIKSDDEVTESVKTSFIRVQSKTIVNKVDSPDIPFSYSINPYQGCEHGCVYCYARPTHNYWGYSSGLDFESKILVKENAPLLLKNKLKSKKWEGKSISLSGNTDCYQPLERKFKLTRELLSICSDQYQSVGIVTKNRLITRDLDILAELNKYKLVYTCISINTLDDTLRARLEPRASTIETRLKTIEELAKNNIPVMALMAPIIPGLNDHEIMPLVKRLSEIGVSRVAYTIVRLNHDLDKVFGYWLDQHYPDRKSKVLNAIMSCHQGRLKDNEFGHRMRGSGQMAENIRNMFRVARQQYLRNEVKFELDESLFLKKKNPQLNLF